VAKEIPIKCKGNRYLSHEVLKDFQGNLKKITKENLEKLKKSIIQNGWVAPVFVWNGNYILDGHGRLKALRELIKEGYSIGKIPVADIEAETKEEAGKILLAINSHYQEITEEGLKEFIADFNIDIESLNDFILPDVNILRLINSLTQKDGIIDDDEVPEVGEEPITKYGDLYILGGKHRVLCGDATKKEDVEKLMDRERADLVFTDPPYNIGFSYNLHKDKMKFDEYKQFCKSFFELLDCDKIIMTPGPKNLPIWYEIINIRDIGWLKIEDEINEEAEEIIYDEGVWVKKNTRSGASCFHFRVCEPIIFYGKFNKKRTFDWFDYKRVIKKELIDAVKVHNLTTKHAPAKPVAFIVDLIKSFSEEGDLIKDVFLGSGTTLIACEKTNRICYGMELDPHYCDVIVERYCQYTGQRDIIKNGVHINWRIKHGK
jgi:DNA modification methylase